MQPNYAPRGAPQPFPPQQQAPRSSPSGAPGAFNPGAQFAANQQPLSQPSQPQFQARPGFPGPGAGFPQQGGPPGSNGRPAYPSNYPGQQHAPQQQGPPSNGRPGFPPGGFPGQQQPTPGSNGRPGYAGGFPGQQPPPQGPSSSNGRPGGAPIQSPSGFRPGQQQFSQGPPSSGGGGVPPNNQFQPGRPGAPPNRAPGFPGQPQPGMQPPPQQPGLQPLPNQQPPGAGGPPMMNNQPPNNFAYNHGPPPPQGGAPQQPGAPGPNGPPGAPAFNGPPGPQGYNGPPGARPGQPFGAQPPPPPQQQNQPPYGGPPQAGAPYPGAAPAYNAPPGQFQPPGAYPPGPGMQQQQMPQQPQQPQQPKQRIDPTQIPRPIVSGERIQYVARGHTVTMPPAASSDFVCIDEGCCNPRFIRPTLNRVPSTKDIAKQCGLPLAAVICPLAELREDELPIPLVDFGPNGPLRCTRCAGYVNSFTKFIQGGRKFVCNLCLLHNETPRDYYCSVDQNGRRRDVQERAELSRGSVDYIVPAAYTVRPPQEPIFVFVLDVSLFSFQSTLAPAALHAIEYLLPALAQNKRKKIGIITFDTTVHYYRMDRATGDSDDEGNHGITMSVCPDIEDPPAPLPPSSWLVSMDDPAALNKVRALTRLIGKSFENTTTNQAVSGAALWSTVDALEATGGRIILLHAGAPRLGVGRVKREEVTGAYGTTKEVDLYTPDGDGSPSSNLYEALARRCADKHISLDVFSVANSFASLADIARVCELTGGRAQYMPQFEKEKSNNQHHLRSLLQRLVDRDCGYEAVLKVRCSAGLRVDKSFGNFYRSPQSRGAVDEMEFSVIDQDRSICVTLAHDETLAEGTDAYIQAALLYTRSDGIRCVRVHNLALPVEPLLSNVFRFADLDATCSVWQRVAAKQFCDKSLMRATPSAVKDQLLDECVTVLFNYRKHCAASSSSGQLILPESLKLLPLYTLATLKSRALRANLVGNPPRGFIDVRADERVMMMGLLNSLPVEFAVSAVYPKLYSLHDMPENCVTFDEDTGSLVLPEQLPPTAEKLEENGIFLLHSAMCCYLYIGPKVQSELLLELFGVEHADTAESTLDLFEKLEDEEEGGLRDRVRTLVEYLNSTIPISQPLEILTKNDWRANRFMSALVEDRTRNDVSYVEFLVQVHKKIQYKFH